METQDWTKQSRKRIFETMNESIDKTNLAVRTARKIHIQNATAGKRKRDVYNSVLDGEVSFLELDSSISLQNELANKHLTVPTVYNQFSTFEILENFGAKLQLIGSHIAHLEEFSSFCFFYDWKCVGAAIIDSRKLGNMLSELMFESQDEIAIYSPELNKAVLLTGDRTGTGDILNQLSISIFGADWQRALNVNLA